jgi:hypothetical protein
MNWMSLSKEKKIDGNEGHEVTNRGAGVESVRIESVRK